MAIQVRLDLTPSEFDLLRRALDAHIAEQSALANTEAPVGVGEEYAEWSKNRNRVLAEASLARLLREKLNV
jgi:hypothetical protein